MNILPTSAILQQEQLSRRLQSLVWTEQREPHVFNDCSQPKYISNSAELSVLFPSEFSGLVQQRSVTALHSSTHFVTFICCHQSQCLNRVNESQGNYPIYFKQHKMSLPSVEEFTYLKLRRFSNWEIEVFIYRCYKEAFQEAYQSTTKLALNL